MKKPVIATVAVSAVLVAGVGVVYVTGTYDGWRDGRQLKSACGGLVDAAETQRALGVHRVSGKRLGDGCRAFDPDSDKGSLEVSVHRGRELDELPLDEIRDPALQLLPVRGGWPAVVSAGGGAKAYATGSVPCGKSADDAVVVSLRAVRSSTGTDADRRGALARLMTRALKNAAGKQGCALPDTKDVKDVAPGFDGMKAPGEATGTCRGTGLRSYEAVADSGAPIEQCVPAEPDGGREFKITAYYGPYAKAPRHDPHRSPYDYVGASGNRGGKAWTTASCPAGEALYTIEPLTPSSPSTDLERHILQGFAADSAQRHGCGKPIGADKP
ncbi:hypothetical protein [Streptomyces sp. NPDC023838]|uniref:hypothetical protein n=1 Tax=Streptomyces sp. NPDC023838 TaxID=3154325 RepID=UPI0033E9370B